jgi:pilus assembly protein Flp/PilA
MCSKPNCREGRAIHLQSGCAEAPARRRARFAEWRVRRRASVRQHAASFIKDRTGVTAIEYGLIAGVLAVAIICNLIMLGVHLRSVFGLLSAAF